MRVLFNALQAANRSGTGVYARSLAASLCDFLGNDLIVLWPSALPVPAELAKANVITVHMGSALRRLYYDHWKTVHVAKTFTASLIHYPATVSGFRRYRRTVVTIHDLAFFRNPDWFTFDRALYYRMGVKRAVASADLILTGSHSTASDLQEFLQIPIDRIRVTPYAARMNFKPMPEETHVAVRAKYRLPDRFFLCLGTFEPRKNLVRCVQAFSSRAEQLSSDLVLAGRWGWKTKLLETAIKQSPVRERIHLPGFIEEHDMPALLNAAVALVYPSLYEGFGLPVLEAMACGTPVITSNGSSLQEVAGDAALFIDPLRLDTLEDALIQIDSSAARREELRQKGLRRAAEFNWQKTATLTLAAYQELVGPL